MKKILLILSLLFITGCVNKEQVFEDYAKEYYDNHMKMVDNIDSATITLDDLRNASDEDGYDLSTLKKCKDTSKITFDLDNLKSIKNIKIELDC